MYIYVCNNSLFRLLQLPLQPLLCCLALRAWPNATNQYHSEELPLGTSQYGRALLYLDLRMRITGENSESVSGFFGGFGFGRPVVGWGKVWWAGGVDSLITKT